LEPLWQLLIPPREVVLLIKPQFEVGRAKVGKNGVVRNAQDQAEAIAKVLLTAQQLGWHFGGLTASPLPGPAGNIEYLLWLKMGLTTPTPALETIRELTQTSLIQLGRKN
jgi:23S rRNA (cytidine1920-2'-O)/16S rRNA (cytidine1409-2'-O)-methyltransferase